MKAPCYSHLTYDVLSERVQSRRPAGHPDFSRGSTFLQSRDRRQTGYRADGLGLLDLLDLHRCRRDLIHRWIRAPLLNCGRRPSAIPTRTSTLCQHQRTGSAGYRRRSLDQHQPEEPSGRTFFRRGRARRPQPPKGENHLVETVAQAEAQSEPPSFQGIDSAEA